MVKKGPIDVKETRNSENKINDGEHISTDFCKTEMLSFMKRNHYSHLEESKYVVTSEIPLEDI